MHMLLGAALLGGASAIRVGGPAQAALGGGGGDATVRKATASEGKPLIDSEALQAAIKLENLLSGAEDLYAIAEKSEPEYGHPTRVIGSKGHHATVDYLQAELAKLGDYYNVSLQEFSAVDGKVFESRLVLGDSVSSSAEAMSMTPSTAGSEPVTGDLVLVEGGGCEAGDFPEATKGNIALISRGDCSFSDKAVNAGRAGAVASVVYNTEPSAFRGSLDADHDERTPTFGISGDEAAPLVERLRGGSEAVSASAYIDAEVRNITTHNVIAQTTGGDQDNCVALGGHSDSVEAGPGINDDGTGTLTVLEVARQLVNFDVTNCVRFAWWSAEEEGLLGSNHYAHSLTPEENLRVRLFMDYDMMASPNYAYQVYNATDDTSPAGSQALRDLYVDWYEEHGLNYTFIPFDGRSDYVGFIDVGIPAGGIATGAEGVKTEDEEAAFGGSAGEWYDPCYHQLCDDLSNPDHTAWEVNSRLVAHSVATYALSLEGFPERTLLEENVVQHAPAAPAAASVSSPRYKYKGHNLVA